MRTYKYSTRIDYSMTDCMGFMHHSNYARVYENARWEWFRSLGLPYAQVEEEGYWMPVINMNFKFHKPVFYDDKVDILVTLSQVPLVKFTVDYKMLKDGELVNEATIELAFMKKGEKRACRAPQLIIDCLKEAV